MLQKIWLNALDFVSVCCNGPYNKKFYIGRPSGADFFLNEARENMESIRPHYSRSEYTSSAQPVARRKLASVGAR
jgi:hypothetical protein